MSDGAPTDVAARLTDAAARLKARSEPAPQADLEALEDLGHARLEIRRARARLAELEADLRGVYER